MAQIGRLMALTTALTLALPPLQGSVPTQEVGSADSYYHFSLAKLHDQQMRFADAIAEFEKAIGIDPDSPRLRYEFARTLYRAGAVGRAMEESTKAIEMDPQDPEPHFLLAQIYKRSVDRGEEELLEKALAEFRRVIELNSRHADAYFYLAHLQLFNQDDPESAAKNFEEFNRLRPSFPQGYNLQARALLQSGKLTEAIDVLEESRERAGEDPANLELLGRLYEETGQSDQAISLYQKVYEVEPTPELKLRLASLLSGQGRFDEAIPLFRELVEKDPENPLNKVELGKALEGARRYQDATEVLAEVLEKHPDLTEANYYMASSLRGLGRRKEAIDRVRHLLEVTADVEALKDYRNRFRSFLGVLYQEDGQYDRAVDVFEEICKEFPEDGRAKLGLVYALEEAGRLEEAVKLSDSLLQSRPEDLELVDLVITKARVLSMADRLDEAIELISKTLEESRDEDYYLAAAQLYSEHRRFDRAQEIVLKGLETHPESERMQFQLAALYERQGKFDQAENEFKKILASNPDHASVLNYLGYMLAERGLRLEEAKAYVERALELEPHNGAYLDSLGWVYFKLNRLDQAELNLTRANEINDTDSTILEHLGDLYRKLGKHDKATQYYEKSVAVAEDPEEQRRVQEKLNEINSEK